MCQHKLNIKNQSIIDLRPYTDFCQGHLHNACNLPLDTLADNMHQLPDASQPLVICGTTDDLQTAATFLTDKGYQVTEQILWNDTLSETIDCQSVRLWQPSLLVQQFIDNYAPSIITQGKRGLDVACGAGRDTVYLTMNGWQMTGIDYRQDALNRVHSLAQTQNISVETQQLDLETGENPFTDLQIESFDLITVSRYLHRPLFPYLKALLKPQGVLLYHTFMQGSEVFGSPKNPNFLLKPQELVDVFRECKIWQNEVIALADGRPMSYFIAQKPL